MNYQKETKKKCDQQALYTASPLLVSQTSSKTHISEPEQFLTMETLALEFKKRGLPIPHRNSLLIAEKNLRFPRRFHLGGPWSPALWKKTEIDAFFTEAADERPVQRWRPRAELERELSRRGSAS